ncbi:YheC/YheD family protein [Alteribacter populi]|uniref:YheC/YheD family protein n=1 Tax=Alteribacter populi TaxID=2011011 RepID=UPI000BBAB363|nr:YheC/YheD family protein [Alteribacter populi]
MIGIIVSKKQFFQLVNDTSKVEKLSFYQRFADEHNAPIVFYFLSENVVIHKQVDGYVIRKQTKPLRKTMALPRITYCRAAIPKRFRSQLDSLAKKEGYQFYQIQSAKERNKWRHLSFLKNDLNLSAHIPETRKLSWKNMMEVLNKHKRVILKPERGALGRRIIAVNKGDSRYLVKRKVKKKLKIETLTAKELKDFCLSLNRIPYLVQQEIQSVTWRGRTVECRMSVQKAVGGTWQVTAKAIRLAQRGDYLTNIAQGATAHPFSRGYISKAKTNVEELGCQIASQLEKNLPIIDVGLDLMVDTAGRVWFIEANLKDQRLTYKAAGELEAWYEATAQPLRYILAKEEKIWNNAQSVSN